MPGSAENVKLLPYDPASPHFQAVVNLYNTVWGHEGEEAVQSQIQLRRHATYPGYKGLAALLADWTMVGFAYGTTDLPGQWWHERIAPILGPHDTAKYLTRSFAVTELAVAPAARRLGLGRRLLDALLSSLEHTHATLSTQCDNLPARGLYESSGWRVLIERMRFSDGGTEYVIFHRDLP
jgi:ribosomal protein S18 acetylase RimI-like enzyme